MDDLEHRYSRQILFSGIGRAGQERIRGGTVGLVGLGALGSPLAETMVRAGVGRLIAVDRDVIETSNLHRQGLYTEADAAARLPKAVAAQRRLEAMNPDVRVEALAEDFNSENALDLFGEVDLLLDGTDGFETRYLLNDLAVELDIPWIYGACVGATGMTATVVPGRTPCLTCLFPDPPAPGTQETCDTAGIIAPAALIVASLQSVEALKILSGHADRVRHSLLSIELWPYRVVEVGGRDAAPRSGCRTCVERDLRFLYGDRRSRAISLCGRNSVQIIPGEAHGLSLADLAERLKGVGDVQRNDFVLTLTVADYEISVFDDGRGLVKGTTDIAEARSVYGRYIGL